MAESYFAGIDAGSTYIKVALIKGNEIIDTAVASAGIDNSGIATSLLNKVAKDNGITIKDIRYTIATGYSRKIMDIADDNVSEITAHANGARLTAPKSFNPGIIIDIGGQDCKIIYLDKNYGVKNFSMNDKCAAGTGKFLETSAQILGISADRIGEIALESKEPCDISSTCVVFAQSEIISLIAKKRAVEDILAGLLLSMVKRIIKMIRLNEINGDIMLTGGGGMNIGLIKTFESELMRDVYVAEYSQYNGAVGAALLAREQIQE